MATHDDWSTLPSDLVNRVGDCFLATNDLDYYMAFRAVCHPWRAATDDPRSGPPADPRFRPRHWVMLSRKLVPSAADADVPADGDTAAAAGTVGVFVNVATGRVLRIDLPLLRRHYLIATAAGGFLVLADRDHPPHAMRVLNPFTGSSIRFMAPAPSEAIATAHLFLAGPAAPTLALVCRGRSFLCFHFDGGEESIYSADPGSERLRVEYQYQRGLNTAAGSDDEDEDDGGHNSFSINDSEVISVLCRIAQRQAVGGGDLMTREDDILVRSFGAGDDDTQRLLRSTCFLVESAGETLMVAIRDTDTGAEVFRLDAKRALFEPVGGMGSRALFVGDWRCLFVDADNFPSIRGNCLILYNDIPALLVYDLTEGTETSLDVTSSTTDDAASRSGPEDEEGSASLVQLLADYCRKIPTSELGVERCREDLHEKFRIVRENIASNKDEYDSDD